MLVRAAGGAELRARAFGRDLGAVCGDEVRCRIDPHHDEVHAIEVLPRRNALCRSNARGGAEAGGGEPDAAAGGARAAAGPDLFVVDRYLAAATAAGIAATLVLNKSDLPLSDALAAELAAYARPVLRPCTARLPAQRASSSCALLLPGRTAALVGQSGVGKSSLLRRLAPEAQVTVGGLCATAEGRHTTSATRTFDLPDGAALIDSPGVRDFSPAVEALDERTLGFPEVAQLAPRLPVQRLPPSARAAVRGARRRRERRLAPAPLRELPAAAAAARGAAQRAPARPAPRATRTRQLLIAKAPVGRRARAPACRHRRTRARRRPARRGRCGWRGCRGGRASSLRKCAVASPSTVELVARISSRTPPSARMASNSRMPSCSGPMPSSGDRCPMSTK